MLVEWTMAQRRGTPSAVEPLLSITDPTNQIAYATGAVSLDVAGLASAQGETITQVKWSNTVNRVSGIASGTNVWTANGVPLQSGRTNLIILTASTASWAPSVGGTTTFSRSLSVQCALPIQLAIAWDQAGVRLNWSGGVPPYRVQQTTRLGAGDWLELLTDAVAPVSLPLDQPSAFYRVVGR